MTTLKSAIKAFHLLFSFAVFLFEVLALILGSIGESLMKLIHYLDDMICAKFECSLVCQHDSMSKNPNHPKWSKGFLRCHEHYDIFCLQNGINNMYNGKKYDFLCEEERSVQADIRLKKLIL